MVDSKSQKEEEIMKLKFQGDLVDEDEENKILASISAYSMESFEEQLHKLELAFSHAKYIAAGGEEEWDDDEVVGVGDEKQKDE